MNAVGIDVSKGKSMIAAVRPFGEVIVTPYEVRHTASELRELAKVWTVKHELCWSTQVDIMSPWLRHSAMPGSLSAQ
jgi:hypothetical protein